MKFKWKMFGNHLRADREGIFNLGLRQAAKRTRIAHATWSRAERGLPITVPVFLYLCEWMNRNPRTYMVRRAKPADAL